MYTLKHIKTICNLVVTRMYSITNNPFEDPEFILILNT